MQIESGPSIRLDMRIEQKPKSSKSFVQKRSFVTNISSVSTKIVEVIPRGTESISPNGRMNELALPISYA